MPLQNIGARVRNTSAFSFVSKLVSSLLMISVLAVSMPAAPRMVVDAAPKFPPVLTLFDSALQSLNPLRLASDLSVRAIDTTPVLGVFHNAAAFAVDVKSVVLPSVPAGLENAKLPNFNERTFAFFTPILAFFNSSTTTSAAAAAPASPQQPTSVVDFDFDNDGKADIGRWHGALSDYDYKVRNSNGGSESRITFTTSSGKIAPGDFNGDGRTDAAVFNGGTWTYKTSSSATAQTISFGTAGDIPVAGDYDGDGTTDAAVYRPSTNTWWIRKSSGGTTNTTFGAASDITVPGDYS